MTTRCANSCIAFKNRYVVPSVCTGEASITSKATQHPHLDVHTIWTHILKRRISHAFHRDSRITMTVGQKSRKYHGNKRADSAHMSCQYSVDAPTNEAFGRVHDSAIGCIYIFLIQKVHASSVPGISSLKDVKDLSQHEAPERYCQSG